MKTCIIYSFSGTGNSLKIAEFIKNGLTKYDVETTIFRIIKPFNKEEIPDPNEYDYVGFTYPIHGFNTPKPFNDFIKLLPNNKNKDKKKFFIAKCSGEPFFFNNSSSNHFVKILKRKGYQLDLEHHFLMPYNIMFNYPRELMKQMYVYSNAVSEVFCKEIINNTHLFKIKYSFFTKTLSVIVRLVWIAGPVNAKLTHIKKKKCIKCYQCIKNCPTHSLYLSKNGKIKLHPSCCICMNCAFSCPTDAFFMGFLNPWRVNFKGFQYDKLLKNKEMGITYVQDRKKGYFKKFQKYYAKQDLILKDNGININNYIN